MRAWGRRRATGFTLTEILVSLVIVAGGVLGNVAMHANALRHNSHGLLHVRAIRLGGDIATAIRLFPESAGGYGQAPAPNACMRSAAICTPDAWARLMLHRWHAPGPDALPAVSLRVSGGAPPAPVRVEIRWTGAAGERHRWRQDVTIEPGA